MSTTPTVECPRWMSLLALIGDAHWQRELARAMARSLRGEPSLCVLSGGPRTGKSVVLMGWKAAVGREHAATFAGPAQLGRRFAAAVLVGKRLCVLHEMGGVFDDGERLRAIINAALHGDEMRLDRKFHEPVTVVLTCTFVLVAQTAEDLGLLSQSQLARAAVVDFARPIGVLPFTAAELEDEAEGIRAWALREGVN